MEFCDISCYLIILAFSTIPFSGIFLTPTNSIYSNCAYYSSNDAGCTSSLKALFDYLSATEFMAFIKLLLPEGKLLQLTAALIHSLNSLLLFTLLDDMLYFIRLYGKYIRRACSAVMTIIFASNSMQIALIKLSTMKSLVFMASMSFLLAASVVAIKFLKARNNNKSFMRCHVLFLATCLFLTFAALIDTKSMTITLIVAGTIAMDKVRQYLPLRWVEKLTFLAILLWSYLFCIRFMQCSLVGDVVRELLVFSKPVSLLNHIISITHMLSAHCHHLSNLTRTLLGAPADRNPECTADKLESLGKILVNLKGTKWMIDMSSILDILAVMAIIVVFCFLRFLWITCRGGYFNYVTFSCIFLPVYMLSSATSPIVDNIVPGLHALEISMMCYMPSCFLSICLGKIESYLLPSLMNREMMMFSFSLCDQVIIIHLQLASHFISILSENNSIAAYYETNDLSS